MSPLAGHAIVVVVCSGPVVTSIVVSLSTMDVLPVNVYGASAVVASESFLGGSSIVSWADLKEPWKFGVPEQPESCAQPWPVPETSMESEELRPKVGTPQTSRSSLVCSGPLTLSKSTKRISEHQLSRAARYLSAHSELAVSMSSDLYAIGSDVSYCVK